MSVPRTPSDLPCVTTYFPGSGKAGVYLRPESDATIVAGTHSLETDGGFEDPELVRQSLDEAYVLELVEGLRTGSRPCPTRQSPPGGPGSIQ